MEELLRLCVQELVKEGLLRAEEKQVVKALAPSRVPTEQQGRPQTEQMSSSLIHKGPTRHKGAQQARGGGWGTGGRCSHSHSGAHHHQQQVPPIGRETTDLINVTATGLRVTPGSLPPLGGQPPTATLVQHLEKRSSVVAQQKRRSTSSDALPRSHSSGRRSSSQTKTVVGNPRQRQGKEENRRAMIENRLVKLEEVDPQFHRRALVADLHRMIESELQGEIDLLVHKFEYRYHPANSSVRGNHRQATPDAIGKATEELFTAPHNQRKVHQLQSQLTAFLSQQNISGTCSYPVKQWVEEELQSLEAGGSSNNAQQQQQQSGVNDGSGYESITFDDDGGRGGGGGAGAGGAEVLCLDDLEGNEDEEIHRFWDEEEEEMETQQRSNGKGIEGEEGRGHFMDEKGRIVNAMLALSYLGSMKKEVQHAILEEGPTLTQEQYHTYQAQQGRSFFDLLHTVLSAVSPMDVMSSPHGIEIAESVLYFLSCVSSSGESHQHQHHLMTSNAADELHHHPQPFVPYLQLYALLVDNSAPEQLAHLFLLLGDDLLFLHRHRKGKEEEESGDGESLSLAVATWAATGQDITATTRHRQHHNLHQQQEAAINQPLTKEKLQLCWRMMFDLGKYWTSIEGVTMGSAEATVMGDAAGQQSQQQHEQCLLLADRVVVTTLELYQSYHNVFCTRGTASDSKGPDLRLGIDPLATGLEGLMKNMRSVADCRRILYGVRGAGGGGPVPVVSPTSPSVSQIEPLAPLILPWCRAKATGQGSSLGLCLYLLLTNRALLPLNSSEQKGTVLDLSTLFLEVLQQQHRVGTDLVEMSSLLVSAVQQRALLGVEQQYRYPAGDTERVIASLVEAMSRMQRQQQKATPIGATTTRSRPSNISPTPEERLLGNCLILLGVLLELPTPVKGLEEHFPTVLSLCCSLSSSSSSTAPASGCGRAASEDFLYRCCDGRRRINVAVPHGPSMEATGIVRLREYMLEALSLHSANSPIDDLLTTHPRLVFLLLSSLSPAAATAATGGGKEKSSPLTKEGVVPLFCSSVFVNQVLEEAFFGHQKANSNGEKLSSAAQEEETTMELHQHPVRVSGVNNFNPRFRYLSFADKYPRRLLNLCALDLEATTSRNPSHQQRSFCVALSERIGERLLNEELCRCTTTTGTSDGHPHQPVKSSTTPSVPFQLLNNSFPTLWKMPLEHWYCPDDPTVRLGYGEETSALQQSVETVRQLTLLDYLFNVTLFFSASQSQVNVLSEIQCSRLEALVRRLQFLTEVRATDDEEKGENSPSTTAATVAQVPAVAEGDGLCISQEDELFFTLASLYVVTHASLSGGHLRLRRLPTRDRDDATGNGREEGQPVILSCPSVSALEKALIGFVKANGSVLPSSLPGVRQVEQEDTGTTTGVLEWEGTRVLETPCTVLAVASLRCLKHLHHLRPASTGGTCTLPTKGKDATASSEGVGSDGEDQYDKLLAVALDLYFGGSAGFDPRDLLVL